MQKDFLGIYVHVPFCKTKCPYCDFYSVSFSENLIEKYVKIVCNELFKYSLKTDKTVNTIYFGGGTPSLLSTKHIFKILENIQKNFMISNPEITMEVNPADCDIQYFREIKNMGVNRISLGVQSLEDSQLKILGRRHTVKDSVKSFENIKSAGIHNISFDFMIGIPEQNLDGIDNFFDFCENNFVPHISAYILKIEKGTPYFYNKKNFIFPTDDQSADMYEYVCKKAKNIGYNHYEISNFSYDNFESIHNMKYWNLDEYIGIGPGAHSLFENKRFYYSQNLSKFINAPKILNEGIFEPEKEYIMLALRTKKGVINEEFKKKFNKNIPEEYFKMAEKFLKYGLIEKFDGGFRLTEESFLLSNGIISEII